MSASPILPTPSAPTPPAANAPAPNAPNAPTSTLTHHRCQPDPTCGSQGPDSGPNRPHSIDVVGLRKVLVVQGSAGQRIAAIADAQRGRISRTQLQAAWISASTIKRLVATGRLHRLHRGVYAVGHRAPIELGPETAALLACPGGAVLSHATAAALWGLLSPHDGPVDVTVPESTRVCHAGIRIHRARSLQPLEVRTVHGLPVTSPARTVFDLAAEGAGLRVVEGLLEQGRVRRVLTDAQLREVLARHPRRRGRRVLINVLEAERGFTRSRAERRMRALIKAAGLPMPVSNAHVHGFEVDLFWPDHGLVAEFDSYTFHSGRRVFEHDRAKAAKLTAAGLPVMRITWLQIKFEPFAVIANLAQALARAESRAG